MEQAAVLSPTESPPLLWDEARAHPAAQVTPLFTVDNKTCATLSSSYYSSFKTHYLAEHFNVIYDFKDTLQKVICITVCFLQKLAQFSSHAETDDYKMAEIVSIVTLRNSEAGFWQC